jgi:hypothetical protein
MPDEAEATKSRWSGFLIPVVAAACATVLVTLMFNTGGSIIGSGNRQAEFGVQIERLNKAADRSNDKLDAIQEKFGALYTRQEAQADREENRRRFEAIERRLDSVERNLFDIPGARGNRDRTQDHKP